MLGGARGAGLHGVLVDPFGDGAEFPCARHATVAALAAEINPG